MASIIYTCTNKSNTRNERTVAFSNFVASGDTDKNIGLITSITYEHWHSSSLPRGWELSGRLIFGDGTSLTSSSQTLSISGNVVKFTNTFSVSLTSQQWSLLTSIQTLDSRGSTTSNSGYYGADLFWRATASHPMRIIITFDETPPAYYVPDITTFSVQRVNSNGVADDEGSYIATTMKLTFANSSALSIAALRVYYAANAYPIVGESSYIDLTSKISTLMNGVALNSTVITGQWDIKSSWYFAAVLIAGNESDVATSSIARAGGSLHISDQPGGGVCVCGYSTGTTTNPKFESYAPAYFYGGIADFGGTSLVDLVGIQRGITATQRIGSGGTGEFSITFPKAYTSAPTVIANLAGDLTGSSTGHIGVVIVSTSTTGCLIRVGNSSGAAYEPAITWVSIGTMS